MRNDIKTLYLCYLTTARGIRIGIIYNFLKTPQGRYYFDTYSTENDSIKKFLDGLRHIVKDERVQ